MKQDKLYDIINSPVYTEKATTAASMSKYTFDVAPKATKAQIKKAVETIFEKDVVRVNIVNLPAKTKVFKGKRGERSKRRKAVVTLKQGQVIENILGA